MKTGFLVILTTKTWSPSLWRPFFCGEVLHALHYVKSKPSYKCLISAISRKKSQRGKPQCTGSLSSALSAGSWTLQTIPSSPGALGCTSIMSKNWMSFLSKVFSKKISHFLRVVGMVQLHHCKCSRFQEVSSSTIVNEICRSPVTHTHWLLLLGEMGTFMVKENCELSHPTSNWRLEKSASSGHQVNIYFP